MKYSFPKEVKLDKDTKKKMVTFNNMFTPHDTFSINANSENKDMAGKFIQKALSTEVQKEIGEGCSPLGMPINIKAIDTLSENSLKKSFPFKENGNEIVPFKEGETEGVKVHWPTEDEFDKITKILKGLDTQSCVDKNITMKTLFDNADALMEGSKTSAEVSKEVVNTQK